MNRSTVASLIAAGRVVIGITALADPVRVARPWIGDDAEGPSGRALARALGVRDLVIGGATLASVQNGDDPAGWLVAGVLADGVDLLATVAEPDIPARSKLFIGALAGGAVAAQVGALLLLGERDA